MLTGGAGVNSVKVMYIVDGIAISIGKLTDNVYTDDQWHHVVGIYDGLAGSIDPGNLAFYIDGVLVSPILHRIQDRLQLLLIISPTY